MKLAFRKLFELNNLIEKDYELTENECAIAFGKSLKRLRALKGLSLDKLSEEIGISNPSLNRYENGYNLPSIYNALAISDYFGVNIELMISMGYVEIVDERKGTYKPENPYIEQWVGVIKKLEDFVYEGFKKKYKK